MSLLDQAIAHGGGKVTASGAAEMLGAVDPSYLIRLVACVAAVDASATVAIADEMQARSLSFDTALADLGGLLLKVALAQAAPDALDEEVPELPRIRELAAQLDPESVQLYYQIALQGREDLALAPDEHAGFIMTLLRMLAFRPEGVQASLPRPKASEPKRAAVTKPAAAPGAADALPAWTELVRQLQVTGAARELARNAELRGREGAVFDLVVPKAKAYLAERNYQEKLKAALEQHFGGAVTVKVAVGEVAGGSAAAIETGERDARRAEAARAVHADGFVQDLVSMFDGKIVDSSIRENQK